MSKQEPAEEAFMRRALRLAGRGRGRVEPNPMVGCVVVRGGQIIGEGYHRRFGGPHAEVEALRRCTGGARRATVYVTLEPCCYHGKTPPCTEALLAAGVRRVVVAARDPNPRVSGRSLRLLKRAGLSVQVGVLENQATELNAPFAKLIRQRRPWVILKWAQSLDGKIATHTGDSKWISDETMRAHAHRERGLVDALVVGRRTVQADDPLLTARVGRPRRRATRVVLDARLRTPSTARLVRTAGEVATWIFCTPDAPRGRARRLEAAGCAMHRVPAEAQFAHAGVALSAVLDVLGQHQMTNILVEGGGAVLGSFFDQGLADEVRVYLAPRLIGGGAAIGPLNARGSATVRAAIQLAPTASLKRLGTGWLAQARLPKPVALS